MPVRRAIKRMLSAVFPEYRNGNAYDLETNRGWLKIYRYGSPRTVAVALGGAMIWIETERGFRSRYHSAAALKSIVPQPFVNYIGQLNPVAISMFLRSHAAARTSDPATFPSLRGVEFPFSLGVARGERVVVLDRDFGGFFHFLIEVLPALIRLREQSFAKVLARPELGDKYPFVTQLLRLYQIDYDMADEGACTLTPERAGDIVPSSDIPYYYPNTAAVGALRNRLAEIGWNAERSPVRPSRLLILRRNDGKTVGRLLANEDEVVAALNALGFAPIYCEDYSCEEQARMFAACECVVGVQGAGLANSLYMPGGASIVEIMPESEVKWHFAVLAAHASLRYHMVLAQTVRAAGFRPESVRVDIEKLMTALEAIKLRSATAPKTSGAIA